MSLFSAIVPCYNEEENIDYFYQEFMKNEPFFRDHDLEFELLYVDDGSKDKTVEKVKELRRKDERVHLISFSRNFGKEAAMYAGLEHAKGDYVAVMDADLQDPPSLLPEMFGYLWDGYDQAATRRVTRKGEPPIRSFFARQFYKLINKFSKTEIVDGARDFRLMKRCVVDAILSVKEYNRFSKGIFEWVGFKTRWIEFYLTRFPKQHTHHSNGKTQRAGLSPAPSCFEYPFPSIFSVVYTESNKLPLLLLRFVCSGSKHMFSCF